MRARHAFVIAAALAGLAGCSTTPRTTMTGAAAPARPAAPLRLDGPYVYDYYPRAQVYHDTQRGLWFWRGAAFWAVGDRLPDTIDPGPTAHVLHLETDKPYRVHEQVAALLASDSAEHATAVAPVD
jgi:hypothetical protein